MRCTRSSAHGKHVQNKSSQRHDIYTLDPIISQDAVGMVPVALHIYVSSTVTMHFESLETVQSRDQPFKIGQAIA